MSTVECEVTVASEVVRDEVERTDESNLSTARLQNNSYLQQRRSVFEASSERLTDRH